MMRHFQRMIPEQERPEKIDKAGRQRVSSYLSLQRNGLNTSSGLKTAVTFSVVRHPFERSVSAYQNKMVEEEGPIKRRFLKIYPAGTFSDFADYVLKLARVHCRYTLLVSPLMNVAYLEIAILSLPMPCNNCNMQLGQTIEDGDP